ncbi:unnamed protein product [Rhizophagus irregularis]|nr:unnamed protein product [Rhizophagus irregularis]
MNTPQEYPSTCGASSLSNIKSKFSTEEYPPTANLIKIGRERMDTIKFRVQKSKYLSIFYLNFDLVPVEIDIC